MIAVASLCLTAGVARASQILNVTNFTLQTPAWPGTSFNSGTDFYYRQTRADGLSYRSYGTCEAARTYNSDMSRWQLGSGAHKGGKGIDLTSNPATHQGAVAEYLLEEDKLDFIGIRLGWQINQTVTLGQNMPAVSIQICDGPVYYLESATLASNRAASVSLPNPGTCDSEHRSVRVASACASDYCPEETFIWTETSLRVIQVRSDWVMSSERQDGGQLMVGFNWQLVCGPATSCPLDERWVDHTQIVSLDEAGNPDKIDSSWRYDGGDKQYQIHTIRPAWQQWQREHDGSITGLLAPTWRIDGSVHEAWIAAATEAATLTQEWDHLTLEPNQTRANWQGLAYLSRLDAVNATNFALPGWADWSAGFFVAGRLRDIWGEWSNLSEIFFCQGQSCQTTATPASAATWLASVSVNDATPEASYVAWQNIAGTNWDGWQVVINGQSIPAENTRLDSWGQVRLASRLVTREAMAIKLIDSSGNIIDEATLEPLGAPLSWVRQTHTKAWKGKYVASLSTDFAQ